MANNSMDCTKEFAFHQCYTPNSMTWYDLKSLDNNEQENLNKLKVKMIQSDLHYLHKHPEVRTIIELFVQEVLKYQPQEDLHEFAASYFSQPKFDLHLRIKRRIEEKKVKRPPHTDSNTDCTSQQDPRALLVFEKLIKNFKYWDSTSNNTTTDLSSNTFSTN